MAGVAYAIQEKKKFFDPSLSFDVALLNDSEKSLKTDNLADYNSNKNFQGEATVDWQKMVALSNEISGKILSWDDSNNNLNIIAKNIIEQVDAFISNDSSNNVLVDINPDLDLTEKSLQHNNLNANFSENNASNSSEEIFVEIDSFFLDSAKSLLAQNFTDDNYIENEVSKADTKEKKQTKPDDEVSSDNNKSPESSEIQQTTEPVSASVPVEMVVSSNGLVYGVAFFVAALAGGGGGGGGVSARHWFFKFIKFQFQW